MPGIFLTMKLKILMTKERLSIITIIEIQDNKVEILTKLSIYEIRVATEPTPPATEKLNSGIKLITNSIKPKNISTNVSIKI